MTKSIIKKSMLVLSFMFFFVLFLPITGHELTVYAKEAVASVTDEATNPSAKEILPEIKLNVKSKDIVKGKSYTLKVYNTTAAQTITYKSSDETIACITDKGIVKGIEIGSAAITVIVKEENKTVATLQCEINVGVPAICIRFTKSDVLMVVGQKTTLKYLIAPYYTVEVALFTSLDSEIASISTGGRISAKTVGVTNCYALIDNGYSKCKVTVISEEIYNELVTMGYEDLSTVPSDVLFSLAPELNIEPNIPLESSITSTPTPTPTSVSATPIPKQNLN